MFVTRNTIEQTLISSQEYVQIHIEDEFSLVKGSRFILDSIKCMDIFISRNAVPQAVEAYVKYLTGVRGKKQALNPLPVHDLKKKCSYFAMSDCI